MNGGNGKADKGRRLVFVGGGGHCRSVLDAALGSGMFSEIVVTDRMVPVGSEVLGCKVAGTDEVLAGLYHKGFRYAFVSVGSIQSTQRRQELYQQIRNIGFQVPVIADVSAVAASSASIGSGVFLGKNSVVNANASIGDMAIINSGALVEHDCRIGEFSHLSTGSVICGGSSVAANVFVGANATIIHGVEVGRGSIIGAGSVVLADVPDGKTVVGVWKGNNDEIS